MEVCNFIDKETPAQVFSCASANSLRTLRLQNTCERLLLQDHYFLKKWHEVFKAKKKTVVQSYKQITNTTAPEISKEPAKTFVLIAMVQKIRSIVCNFTNDGLSRRCFS